MGGAVKKTTFQLVMIKPTHYDDDGYPITWLRSHIPSNTLAALYGLSEDCRARQVLGPDVDIVLRPFDETNTRVRPDRIIADVKRSGGKALICLVGVQSNQFPHAVDLARHFIAAGLPVAMGGFHAAGCLSMLPVVPPEIQAAMDMGVTIFAGEAEEGRLDEILLHAWNGTLKPLYNYMNDPPSPAPSPPCSGSTKTRRSSSAICASGSQSTSRERCARREARHSAARGAEAALHSMTHAIEQLDVESTAAAALRHGASGH